MLVEIYNQYNRSVSVRVSYLLLHHNLVWPQSRLWLHFAFTAAFAVPCSPLGGDHLPRIVMMMRMLIMLMMMILMVHVIMIINKFSYITMVTENGGWVTSPTCNISVAKYAIKNQRLDAFVDPNMVGTCLKHVSLLEIDRSS